ncbi:phage baseplate assembly protein V [Pantoea sp. JGM49]|uniref:phage baseplate assembly protein V n=1 Tax=Pantoea sp. JGM49 TaxID=2799791 RepID=UPI001BAE1F69|nr:phage baseplate assembly protein V [Pantoea sp. JGM49]MBS0879000.1 phage baseplate assembly protein V [Pantoea sp. JGM49]
MEQNEQIFEILRLLRNLIRIGTVSAVNLDDGLCRVDTGNLTTGWLHWLTARAGNTRSWNAPSVGEQVIVLCLGGETDTGFVLPAVFSDNNPAPSASADALHWSFPDGAVIEYEPATGALKAAGIQTATIEAAVKILLSTPEVECSAHLKAKTFEFSGGGKMTGDVNHSGGKFDSNGVVVDDHDHGGVQRGGSRTDGPQ